MSHKPGNNSLWLHMAISTIKISVSIPILVSMVLISPGPIILMVSTISAGMGTNVTVPI